jgi:hypothetical protein
MSQAIEVCKHGHEKTPENIDSRGICRACLRVNRLKWVEANPERHREVVLKSRAKNVEKKRAYNRKHNREWCAANREEARARCHRWAAANPEKSKARYHARQRSIDGQYSSMLSSAKERDLEVSITKEEFSIMRNSPCFYCNGALPETGSGLDRVNNSNGYTKDNCRPCCTDCNLAKRQMSETQFKDWLHRIFKHWVAKAA